MAADLETADKCPCCTVRTVGLDGTVNWTSPAVMNKYLALYGEPTTFKFEDAPSD